MKGGHSVALFACVTGSLSGGQIKRDRDAL
jgi:hypothetical protein